MNIFARIANRLGTPYGVRPFPWANECELEAVGQSDVFDVIHKTNYWGSNESLSGGGSTLQHAEPYVADLIKLIDAMSFDSMFDAPCGDLNWMSQVVRSTNLQYIGGDISEVTLDAARHKHPELDLRQFDIRQDPFPHTDVWHCRDCLFHLSFEDGLAALRNFAAGTTPWALITTNSARLLKNIDIQNGGWRLLDLQRKPFNLPLPRARLRDFSQGSFPRYVALWSREEIAKAVL